MTLHVPRGSTHTYKVLETFSAVEATSPPASAHGRDEGKDAKKPAKA